MPGRSRTGHVVVHVGSADAEVERGRAQKNGHIKGKGQVDEEAFARRPAAAAISEVTRKRIERLVQAARRRNRRLNPKKTQPAARPA